MDLLARVTLYALTLVVGALFLRWTVDLRTPWMVGGGLLLGVGVLLSERAARRRRERAAPEQLREEPRRGGGGFLVDRSQRVTVDGNRFFGVPEPVTVTNSTDTAITNNEVHGAPAPLPEDDEGAPPTVK